MYITNSYPAKTTCSDPLIAMAALRQECKAGNAGANTLHANSLPIYTKKPAVVQALSKLS